MDAAKELTWTYLQRVLRGWAGKDPAAKPQIHRSVIEACKPRQPGSRSLEAVENIASHRKGSRARRPGTCAW
ncbi:hypothetical protein XpiCFBP4643_22645 [Xanthomonas pisi]|uniref:Uncharacterized protein n=1 Tax=Xanthomonas pisi TaxID=56457 RepID=A0A2S7CRK2_9XANT|nr:hypothetical protein XpiCFBP4643_22645 [Xanthomonas pisi]